MVGKTDYNSYFTNTLIPLLCALLMCICSRGVVRLLRTLSSKWNHTERFMIKGLLCRFLRSIEKQCQDSGDMQGNVSDNNGRNNRRNILTPKMSAVNNVFRLCFGVQHIATLQWS